MVRGLCCGAWGGAVTRPSMSTKGSPALRAAAQAAEKADRFMPLPVEVRQ